MPWCRDIIDQVSLVEYDGLSRRKHFVATICDRLSLSVMYKKLFLAMAMIESNDLNATEAIIDRRCWEERNFSLFNINGYMIWRMGCLVPFRYLMTLPPEMRHGGPQLTPHPLLTSSPIPAHQVPSDLLAEHHLIPPQMSYEPPSYFAKTNATRDASIPFFYNCFNKDQYLRNLMEAMVAFLGQPSVGLRRFLFFVRAGADGYFKLEKTGYEWEYYMAGVGTSLDFLDRYPHLLTDSNRIEMPIPHIDGSKPQGAGERPTLTKF